MSKIPSIRAYLGPEDGLRNEALGELRAFIKKQTGGPAEEHRCYIPEDSLDDAFEVLQSGSLFGDHRLVLLAGAEQIRKKADVQRVADYVKRPPEGATLVLISDAVRLDSKLEKAVPGDSRKVFWELFENQKRGWVQGHFRKRNVPITNEALELFLELVENNTQELRLEADKLIVYFQSRAGSSGADTGAIGVDEVESFVYHSRDENVFSLHRKLVDGDFDGALEVLSKIEGSGEANPAQLIGGLAFQTRRLIALRSLLDNGFSQEEAFKRLSIRGKRIQSDYRDAISRFGSSELRRQMVQLVQFEAAIREHGNAIQPLLLELLVYRLVFPGEELLSSDDRAFA